MSLQRQTPTQRLTSIPAPNFYPSAKLRSSEKFTAPYFSLQRQTLSPAPNSHSSAKLHITYENLWSLMTLSETYKCSCK